MNAVLEYPLKMAQKPRKCNSPDISLLTKRLEPLVDMPILLLHPLLPKHEAVIGGMNELILGLLELYYAK